MTRRSSLIRGYTMIEVMVALAVLAIGATGVMALQRVTLIANSNARNVAMANSIASGWVERLRADAVQWNNPTTGSDLSDTRWLNSAVTAPSQWVVPDSTAPFGSAWSDINGDDIYGPPDQLAAYCTHIRFTQLYPLVGAPSLIRAEIRVFWARNEMAIDCSAADPTLVTSAYDRFGFVYVTTAVLNNVIPNYTP